MRPRRSSRATDAYFSAVRIAAGPPFTLTRWPVSLSVEPSKLAPAIPDARDFNLTYVGADPGKGAALHAHPTVEVFVALTGRWAVYWGDEGEQEVVLEPFDTISIPPGVMRGFRNAGPEHGYLMAILGGTDSGKVAWAKSVLARAKETGLGLDARGNLVELAR